MSKKKTLESCSFRSLQNTSAQLLKKNIPSKVNEKGIHLNQQKLKTFYQLQVRRFRPFSDRVICLYKLNK